MKNQWFIIALFPVAVIALIALSAPVHGQDQAQFTPFDRGEYSAEAFSVTARTYPHGRVKVKVTQAKRVDTLPKSPPYFCSAWLEVAEGGKNVWQRSFEDIRPSGFSYGLFVPQKPPAPRYFALVKAGDNDGRLYLVDREDGTVFDLPGGFYFVTMDNRYLFSEYAGATQQVAVFDLIAGKILLDTKTSEAAQLPGEIYDWYYDGRRYFFTVVKGEANSDGMVAEDRSTLYEVNLRHPGIAKVPADFSTLHHKRWDFDPRTLKDCFSDPGNKKEEKLEDERVK